MEFCSLCDIAHEVPAGCPLCESDEKVDELEGTVEDLKNEVEGLKDEISSMEE